MERKMTLGELLADLLSGLVVVVPGAAPAHSRPARRTGGRPLGRGKLTAAQVRAIRAGDPGKGSRKRWQYYKKAASVFSVSPQTISHIVTRRTWKRVRATRKAK